ncbi:MAG TPA: DNA replication and repair protein RecF, partial [Candidatus Bathyarchaeia archaeon]|nr:DNA replication and repair protein RecF [Candidatus Bathyarchaeia archaeon]
MFLKNLNLNNFRSFKEKKLDFSPQTTVIIGPNAVGKTNILEAIYLLATGKSFRASREQEMIKYGEELSKVKAEVGTNLNLDIILTTGEIQGKRTARKLYKINGVGKRWRDFAGILKTVLFRPEDIDLILGPPSLRRDFLDSILEQADWQYRSCILAYKKGLRQRNKLLDRIREGEATKAQLTFWDQLLCKNGQLITQKREELIEFFNNFLERIEVFYDRSTISQQRLEKYHKAELALGMTLVGPHRDNLEFRIQNSELRKERNLALFGSRGEQRMAVLDLRLAELEFIKAQSGEQPVLLLDDIFSELDKKNRRLVLKIID